MPDARILIVEDEAIEAMDIQQRLTSLGYPMPEIAHNGEEGVRKVEELRPDLVLMDIMMPGKLDGVAAAGQIRARFDIPIIYLTAYADENTLRRAKITEPYGYIVKPFQERELHITIDIALYKFQMEKKLREREKWLATTLKSIGDGVIATDEAARITFMNPVAEKLTGWGLAEARQGSLTEVFTIVNRETRQPVENPVTRVLREGKIVGLANHTVLISRQGDEIAINDSAAPIQDDKGNILGVILVFSDITEREQAQEALRQRTAELEMVNRDLEAYSYTVSHDLKAPLRSIKGFTQAIVDDYGQCLDEAGRDYLGRVVAASDRMGQLIDAMLAMSRLTKGEMNEQTVNLSAMARVIAAELNKKEPGRQVQFNIADGIKAKGDPTMLEAVLENLLNNAWKFTGRHPSATIEFGLTRINGKDTYFVRDDGAGFDMTYADMLFLPFRRLHREAEFPGLGIGLGTVQRIIRRHGGQVWAEGEKEKGATFYFTLD